MNSSNPYKPIIAVVLSRFPFPLEKGDKLRAYYQLVDLSKNFEIQLICTTDRDISENEIKEVQKFCKEIHIFKLNKILILGSLIAAFFGRKPFQVHYFHQAWIQRKINILLQKIKPEHIYCQLIRTSEYVKNYHACQKTIDYMDALSKGMERRMEQSKCPKKWLFNVESKRLANYERQIFDYFEHHTIISEQDRNYILHPKKSSITLVRNGVDQKFFEFAKSDPTYNLVFTGNMGYPPNIEATHYLKEKIFPLLSADFPEINCLISGASPHASILSLEANNFHIGGWVEDMRSSYRDASIFVAPMMLGTGLQNKLLEAMAMGLPCITTTLANNALGAIPGIEILIANNEIEFAEQIGKLMKSKELHANISIAGRLFVQENYQWEKANVQLINLIAQ